MSLTKVSYSMIQGAPVNIVDFGANTSPFDSSSAIAAAKIAGSGFAYVPGGVYFVSPTTDIGGLYGPGRILQNGIENILPASPYFPAKNNCSSLFVDLHYGILSGTPWLTGEIWSGTGFDIGVDVPAGATSFTSTGAVPIAGQLIQYLSKNGYRYVAVVKTVVGAVVTLDRPVVGGIAAGSPLGLNISSFYANSGPHPNVYGYQAIVDYWMLNPLKAYDNLQYQVPAPLGPGVVAQLSGNNVLRPGGATYPAFSVTPSGTQGCQFNFRASKTGTHVLRIHINTQGADLVVSWSTVTVGGTFSNNTTINTNAPRLVEIPIWVQKSANDVAINVVLGSATNTVFYLARAEWAEYNETTASSLNFGKHVLLGDSWFNQTGIAEQMRVRLPNAIIANKGIGGNTASDLINRFAVDVTPEKPNFVWIMVGTNDAGASVDPDLFAFYIQRLKSMIQEIGATPIFYGPSVGTTLATTFDYSRQYADETPYIDQDLENSYGAWTPADTGFTKVGSPVFTGSYVKSGGICHCTLTIAGGGSSSSASTAGVSTVTGLPFTPLTNDVCVASNGAIANLGTGLLFAATGTLYVPSWSADPGTVTISFSYLVA